MKKTIYSFMAFVAFFSSNAATAAAALRNVASGRVTRAAYPLLQRATCQSARQATLRFKTTGRGLPKEALKSTTQKTQELKKALADQQEAAKSFQTKLLVDAYKNARKTFVAAQAVLNQKQIQDYTEQLETFTKEVEKHKNKRTERQSTECPLQTTQKLFDLTAHISEEASKMATQVPTTTQIFSESKETELVPVEQKESTENKSDRRQPFFSWKTKLILASPALASGVIGTALGADLHSITEATLGMYRIGIGAGIGCGTVLGGFVLFQLAVTLESPLIVALVASPLLSSGLLLSGSMIVEGGTSLLSTLL